MALAGEILSLLRDSASPDIRPDKASERLWHLTYPSLFASHRSQRRAHVDAVKARMLETVTQTGQAIIHSDFLREEKPPGKRIEGQQPDRATVTDALSWVDELHIQVVMDSFHDDVSWVVVLASELPAA